MVVIRPSTDAPDSHKQGAMVTVTVGAGCVLLVLCSVVLVLLSIVLLLLRQKRRKCQTSNGPGA